MRKLVVFLLVMSAAFATCDEYVASAVDNFGNSCTYPSCFGAAGEYSKAALCYLNSGDASGANTYFQKAADYYLEGISYVGPSGDYPLRAQCYEAAGDMLAQLKDFPSASQYYTLAAEEYLKTGKPSDAAEATVKKNSLGMPKAPTGFVLSSQSLAIGLVIVIIAIAAFLYSRKPEEEKPVQMDFSTARVESIERPAEPQQPSAKDKMKEKIRKKYGLA